MELLEPRTEHKLLQGAPVEYVIKVLLFAGDPERTVQIGALLTGELQQILTKFLWENSDIFAWSPRDMPGIERNMSQYVLDVDPSERPVK